MRTNNFGFLRLLLASLVIVSHSPEIIDKNRSREILTNIFGTISFGELALDGFFMISGYLILNSFQNSSSLKSFMVKRVLRIFPGFIVASLLCIFIFAPLIGGVAVLRELFFTPLFWMIAHLLILAPPIFKQFVINGSMWSIWFEFLCYLSIPIFHYLGIYRFKKVPLVLMFFIVMYLFTQYSGWNIWLPGLLRVDFHHTSRLFSAFLVGSLFYLYREKITWKASYALLSTALLAIVLFNQLFAEIGLLVFGGYLMFYFAFNFKQPLINRIGEKNDISYGLYLYAWPIQILIVKHIPDIQPSLLTLYTLVVAGFFGLLSWKFVEKPLISLKNRVH